MNNHGRIAHGQDSCHHFGHRPVDPALLRFVVGLSLCLFLLLVVAVKPPLPAGFAGARLGDDGRVLFVEARESRAMIEYLRARELWELNVRQPVPPLVFTAFPADIDELRVATRKRLFLHALAPTALVALAEVTEERAELLRIMGRLDFTTCSVEKLATAAVAPRDCGLSPPEADFLLALCDKYRTEQLDVLLKRINVVPLSLILAQAAMESAWGTSRFVQEGNNIFGVWTWGQEGMVPAQRAQGMTHRVAIYDNLLDSVRSYLLMLNRVAAYSTLREIRQESMDSLALVNGLRYYSEKRGRYVDDLRRLIRVNQMRRYDALSIGLAPAEVKRQLAGGAVQLTRLE